MKKLLLINPLSQKSRTMGKANSILKTPPLSLAYVAALTPNFWDIEILDESKAPYASEEADLVGLTSFTHSAPRAYEIAGMLRHKGIKTIMGGIHASMLPQEALGFVDSVVIGDAFDTWPLVIKDFEDGSLKRIYKSERKSLEGVVTPRRDLFPKRTGLSKGTETVQTAVGCPLDCNFCSVTQLYGREYRTRPVEEVLDELEKLQDKGVTKIFFVDDNIVGYGMAAEQRALSLFKGMTERNFSFKWIGQASINVGNNKPLLEYAEKSGCGALLIGFESLNPEVLKKMRKLHNLKSGNGDDRLGIERDYRQRIKRLHDHGIAIIGAFIFGNDGDTKDVFDTTRDFIFSAGIDITQYAPLTPLPGTRLYSQMLNEGRILFTNYPNDWELYDFAHVVGKPKDMKVEELKSGLVKLCDESFSFLPSVKRAWRTLRDTRNPYATAYGFLWNRAFNEARIRGD